MNHAHIRNSRRVAVAVTAVLAVTATAGTLVTAPVAGATVVAGVQDAAAVTLPAGEKLVSAGTTGFLTSKDDGAGGVALTWTRLSDGSRTDIPGTLAAPTRSDTVITREGNRFYLYDMSVSMFTSFVEPIGIGTNYTIAGAAGSTLYLSVPNNYGGEYLYRLTRVNGVQQQEQISPLPSARGYKVVAHSGTDVVVLFTKTDTMGKTTYYRALTNLLGNFMRPESVVESFDPATVTTAVSPSYLAWTEYVDGVTRVAVQRRTEYKPFKTVPVTGGTRGVVVGFSGEWILYGVPGGLSASSPDPLHALTAQNLLSGATVTLLDHFTSTSTAPDGGILVQGGTGADGEGLFKVNEASGYPTASLVGPTPGVSASPTVLGSTVPAVAQLDRNGGQVAMEWRLSRYNVIMDVRLRHTATGKTYAKRLALPSAPARLTWDGLTGGISAPNGDYTWDVTLTSASAIGAPSYTTGAFKVVRQANPHDFSDNGSPDLLARDASGTLWRDDTLDWPVAGQVTPAKPRVKVGAGWNTYNLIESAGNIAGAPAGDVLARDTAGVLWSFLGKGDGTFANRVKVGPGWGVYNKMAAGSDLTGDGKADMVATDTAGVLWLYKGTGGWNAPYSGRTKIGPGWGVYNQLAATGNIAGGPAGDLVARDASGVLWLYQGKGDGTFAGRVRIGGGWNGYSQLVGVGDANNDGRPDLVAYGAAGTHVFLGTGSWSAPFTRSLTSLYAGEGTKFTSVS
ncbi:FG-GAP repeat domain-containing protein [Streptomyces sp. NPDC059534]|uniref:FG-GAP repeat domain-containing protein n=1 Tax=Streptomyces sp. NPDC059534 TaxID=3346859 RepID=UPI00369CC9D4